MEKTNDEKKKMPPWVRVGIIAGTLVLGSCIFGWYNRTFATEGAFTIINSIFSGLAFVGLIIAIFMQREELELQRKELTEAKAEFKQQNDTLKHQRFEATFFNLLSVFNSVRTRIGEQQFSDMWSKLKSDFLNQQSLREAVPEQTELGLNSLKVIAAQEYNNKFFQNETRSILNIYFENFFNTLRYIESNSVLDSPEELFYANVMFSQISNFEVAIVSYHLLLMEGNAVNIELAKKYGLTKRSDVRLTISFTFSNMFEKNGWRLW